MSTIRLLTLSILAALLAAPTTMAQDKKTYKLGMLALRERECGNQPLRTGLSELGYLEGANLVIDCRHGGGRLEGLFGSPRRSWCAPSQTPSSR